MKQFSILLAIFLLVSNLVITQKTSVKGVVIDATTKETIPFATVSFKGTKTGTTTDIDGKFTLESYYSSDSLLVTFLGYKSRFMIHLYLSLRK